MGSEDTWGFDLDFTGANVVAVNTASITDPTTGVTIFPSIPSTSNGSDLEFGDFDGTGGTVFHETGSGQACFTIEVVLDAPATDVALGNTEYTFGPCSNSTTLTSCFPNYTVTINSDVCGSNNISFSFVDGSGNTIVSEPSIPTNGETHTFVYCSICPASFTINAPAGTSGSPSSRCDAGLCCTEGSGSYSVTNGESTVFAGSTMPCAVLLSEHFAAIELEKKSETTALVSWNVKNEGADVYYVVEPSKGAMHFEDIPRVDKSEDPSAGTSVYTFIDYNSFSAILFFSIERIIPYRFSKLLVLPRGLLVHKYFYLSHDVDSGNLSK